MTLESLEKRVAKLENQTISNDELGLILACFRREYARITGAPQPASRYDGELARLAGCDELGPEAPPLLALARDVLESQTERNTEI